MSLTTLAVTITNAGISAPNYNDILASLQDSFRAIYGADIYIEPDSQDGQLLAILASAINDSNNAAIAVFNAFSPTYAQGVGLSSVVKINGIRRNAASNSSAVGDVGGSVGTIINNGVVSDEAGNLWDLPATVTIGITGVETVTVTAQVAGAIVAPTGTINSINTPQLGWQTFVSTADASIGAPVESDAALRRRQTASTALGAVTPLGSIYAALANLDGVTALKVYENPTGAVDSDGLPAHSISVVIQGGDVGDIAQAIGSKKTPGAYTYGTTTEDYTDPITGLSQPMNFFIPDQDSITVDITITAKTGYTSVIGTELKNSIATYINALGIGVDVEYLRLFLAAYMNNSVDGQTYEITTMLIAIAPAATGAIDLVIPFNEIAVCDPDTDITLIVI